MRNTTRGAALQTRDHRKLSAATQIVGSPTPPHAEVPPDGMMIDSTLGISAMRIEL